MGKEKKTLQMEIIIKDNMLMEFLRNLGFITGQMEANIKDNLNRDLGVGMVYGFLGIVIRNIKDNMSLIKNVAMESTLG